MAESNPTQVILTDDGIKIIKAQNTADNAASGIAKLNDPNLMSVIEKQNNIGQFAGLTSQYNVLIQDAKDDGIDTNAITTAYNNLNKFMANILSDPNHASDIDRVTYKQYQNAYNEELAKIQNALQNNTNSKFTSAASAVKQAASTANQAFSEAQSAFNVANYTASNFGPVKQTADSALAAANSAQTNASSAFAKAESTASEFGKVSKNVDNAVASTLNAQSDASNAVKQASSAAADSKDAKRIAGAVSQSYKTLTDGSTMTIAELQSGLAVKLTKKDLDGYATETWAQNQIKATADGINGTMSSIKSTVDSQTTSINDLKADANGFKDQFTKVTESLGKHTTDIGTLQASTKSLSASFNSLSTDNNTNKHDISQLQLDAKSFSSTLATVKQQVTDFSNISQTVDSIKTTVSKKVDNDDFSTYKEQTNNLISQRVTTKDFSTYTTQTSKDINLRVATKDLISQINLQAGNTLISSGGQLTLSGKNIYFDTANPVTIPSANIDNLLVGKKLEAADIAANTFKTNNDTFKVESNGAIMAKNMTLIGGTLSTPTINASTINGSTINGTTFNGGEIISNANNTAKYYPMTITPDGAYKSTYFDSAVGLQSSVESGAISYKYRSMIGNGAYSYDNVAINGQGITLDSGTTTTKDTTFSAPETENAYIALTTEAGLYLHGSNANINFGGHLNDDSTSVGMYMNPYGNLIAKSSSQYWQISVAGNDNTGGGVVARFGIDKARAYNIQFNRELEIGNFQINTGHTITSADNGAIHFAKRIGGAAEIYAGDVHYNSLVKSSLLSVKRDVKKVDTAYWAQLVNSIDLATYQYKTDDNTSNLRLSSIVDDVNVTKQWRLPDVFISRDENGKLNGVDDSVLLNATLATVQEQQKEIDQLNGHLLELEAKLNG